jgi:hypothetical protein
MNHWRVDHGGNRDAGRRWRRCRWLFRPQYGGGERSGNADRGCSNGNYERQVFAWHAPAL